jgi:subtilisin family serine protease
MMNKWTLLLVLWGWTAALHAESYIVLFKNQASLVTGKDAHKEQMQSKRVSNSERIDKLLAALGANKSTVNYQDLWLVSGMELQLKADEISQVQKLDFVERVLVNQTRKYIAPVTRDAPVVMNPGWGLRRLNTDIIRSTYPEINGAGVRVGVIDTGIQSRHPEFEKKNKVVFKDFVNGIAYAYDDNGHGTHVSGTIAGATTGVAPNVDLYVAKAFSATGSASDAWLLNAMQWMYDPDGNPETEDFPHVISNSWGLDIPFDIVDMTEFEAFHRAIVAWVESDIIPVFAAGNSGASPNGMPGGFAEVLSIAAFDATNTIAEFSSRGPNYWRSGKNVLNVFKPDLAAPGVDIYSAMPGNSYDYMSGTSMATPHATGSIALILQKTGRQSLADLKTLLLYSMEPKFDFDFGSGIINPLGALQMLGEPAKRSLSR